jgi:hypothetical protein
MTRMAEDWFRHDINAQNDIALKWYLSKFPDRAQAYGLFWFVIERLYQSPNNSLELNEMFYEELSDSTKMSVSAIQEAIAKQIVAKLLVCRDGVIRSNRVDMEVQRRANLRRERAEAGRAGGKKRWDKSDTKKQMPSKNKQTVPEERRGEESKNINTKKLDPSVLAYPSNLDTPAVRKAVSDWLEHKQGLGKTYKRNRSVEILLKQWASRGPQAFCEAVDHSIGQNYAGVFSPPPKRTTSNGNGIYPEKKALVANYGSLLTEEE